MTDIDCFYINYKDTHRFSKLIIDYLEQHPNLAPYFSFPTNLEGFQEAIEQRKSFNSSRPTLVKALQNQYKNYAPKENFTPLIEQLKEENTFTITTAHQTNLLLGPVYLIYKIMHAIVLADYLKDQFSDYNFLPVYYMGSEDNDWEELNHFYFQGQKYEWITDQSGAFGKAKIDAALIQLINEWKKDVDQVNHPFFSDLIEKIEHSYVVGRTIAEANKLLIHLLFDEDSLIVIDGDDPLLKHSFQDFIKDDLIRHSALEIVKNTTKNIEQNYKTQAHVRSINLFYLNEGIRERIEKSGHLYSVLNTNIHWTEEELLHKLKDAPEQFSPNVILRPLYQEYILPNVGFVGGGSELAYWMQLKDLFDFYHLPFPILILRQSVEMITQSIQKDLKALDLEHTDLFKSKNELMTQKAKESLPNHLDLSALKSQIHSDLERFKIPITELENTLEYSLGAVQMKISNQISILQKKIIRAQKKQLNEYEDLISNLLTSVFPYELGLTERKESFLSYYSLIGANWLQMLKKHTDPMGKKFLLSFFKNNN